MNRPIVRAARLVCRGRALWVAAAVTLHGLALAAPPADAATMADAARFAEVAQKGDRARAAGKYSEAVIAYTDALAIRDDPTIAGRLGLILLEAGMPTKAADFLLDAVERGSGAATEAERMQFFRAYEKARAEVCWLEISVSPVGAAVSIDGEQKLASADAESYIFIRPGVREIRAHLEGYEDAVMEVMATKGGNAKAVLVLRADPAAQPGPAPAPRASPAPRSLPPQSRDVSDRGRSLALAAPPAQPAQLLRLAGGVVIEFGVAPSPAVGLSGTLQYRRSWWSLAGELRAARTFADIEGAPLRTLTLGINLAPCAHIRWFFGCAVVHAGAIYRESVASPFRFNSSHHLVLGGGLQVGVEYFFNPSIGLRATGDIIKLTESLKANVFEYGSIWQGIGLLGATTLGIATKF